MDTVSIQDAEASLATLVERAAAGEEIVIAREGTPVARLVAVPSAAPRPREFGFLAGRVRIGPDFDDPLPPEIQDAFDGKGFDGQD